jgi:hypothetical protein
MVGHRPADVAGGLVEPYVLLVEGGGCPDAEAGAGWAAQAVPGAPRGFDGVPWSSSPVLADQVGAAGLRVGGDPGVAVGGGQQQGRGLVLVGFGGRRCTGARCRSSQADRVVDLARSRSVLLSWALVSTVGRPNRLSGPPGWSRATRRQSTPRVPRRRLKSGPVLTTVTPLLANGATIRYRWAVYPCGNVGHRAVACRIEQGRGRSPGAVSAMRVGW